MIKEPTMASALLGYPHLMKEYMRLLARDKMLEALEETGVEGWEDFPCAVEKFSAISGEME